MTYKTTDVDDIKGLIVQNAIYVDSFGQAQVDIERLARMMLEDREKQRMEDLETIKKEILEERSTSDGMTCVYCEDIERVFTSLKERI